MSEWPGVAWSGSKVRVARSVLVWVKSWSGLECPGVGQMSEWPRVSWSGQILEWPGVA